MKGLAHFLNFGFFVRITYYSINVIIFFRNIILVLQVFVSSRPKDLFPSNRARPWLKLTFKFNRYSERPFKRALVGFNNL